MHPILPRPRANHLTELITSRDLFGVVRGACTGCTSCGKYIIETKEKYTSSGSHKSHPNIHPDNDPSITYCSRCGCPPEAHSIVTHETERELGSDAFALQQWDAAVLHYTRAIEAHSVDATLWSNRAAAYLAKGWHGQALHDAERALSLRPTWYRGWSRKGAALMGLGNPAKAQEAYQSALKYAEGSEREGLERAMKEAKAAAGAAARRRTAKNSSINNVAAVPKKPAVASQQYPAPIDSCSTNSHISKAHSHAPFVDNAANKEESPAVPPSSMATVQALWSAAQQQYTRVTAEMESLTRLMAQLQTEVERCHMNTRPATEIESTGVPPNVAIEKQQLEEPLEEQSLYNSPLPPESGTASTFRQEDYPGEASSPSSDAGTYGSDAIDQEDEETQASLCTQSVSEATPSSVTPLSTAPATAGAEQLDNAADKEEKVADEDKEGELGSLHEENDNESIDPLLEERYRAEAGQYNSAAHSASRSSDEESRGEESSDTDNDTDNDDWVSSVAAAREQMGASGAAGFVPPPLSSGSSRRQGHTQSQRQSQSQHHGQTMPRPAEETPSSENSASAPSSKTSRLSLNSLQSMLLAAATKRRRRDPTGVERVACKSCPTCLQYTNSEVDIGFGIAVPLTGGGSLESAQQQSRQCATCGCDCSRHETEGEAAAREAQVQRTQQRQERFRRQRDDTSKTGSQASQSQREQRIAAAVARKAAAKASGEPLLSTDADVLTHSRRRNCTECLDACPGFRIHYRTTDANDPEVMFYCSLCGCRAEAHAIDAAWQKEDEGRKAAEAAAAARAARARHASTAATLAGRREESEAYAALGLHYGADSKAVTRAYKKLALKLHPDKRRQSGGEGGGGGGVDGEREVHDEFVRVTKAYSFLNGRSS